MMRSIVDDDNLLLHVRVMTMIRRQSRALRTINFLTFWKVGYVRLPPRSARRCPRKRNTTSTKAKGLRSSYCSRRSEKFNLLISRLGTAFFLKSTMLSDESEGRREGRIFQQLFASWPHSDCIETALFPILFPTGTGVFDQDTGLNRCDL